MIRTIIVVLFVVIMVILLIPALLVEWVLGKFNPHAKDVSSFWIVKNLIVRPGLWLVGAHITTYGRENIPEGQPVVFMANHRSMFDCLVMYPQYKGLCGTVSKVEVKKIPLINKWMDNLHCLYVDRDDIRNGLKMILDGIELLKSGISVCIMPEGTRSATDEMRPFKEGSMKLATKSGCPIIPVAITGTAELFENHKPFARPSDVTITFGKPIEVSKLSRDQQKNLGAHVREVVQVMLDNGPGHMVEYSDVIKPL